MIDALTDLFTIRGVPAYIRSDNGPEFIAEAVRGWISAVGAQTTYITPSSPSQRCFASPVGSAWENGYIESFNARLRDGLLNGEIFYSMKEAQIVIEPSRHLHSNCLPGNEWRVHYNTKRPHSSLGYKPPAPESIIHLHERLAVN